MEGLSIDDAVRAGVLKRWILVRAFGAALEAGGALDQGKVWGSIQPGGAPALALVDLKPP